jgi:hypothetical protein
MALWWVTAIGAAAFSWKSTHNALNRFHSPELVSRSIAAAVAIVVGVIVLLALFVLFAACVPRVGE